MMFFGLKKTVIERDYRSWTKGDTCSLLTSMNEDPDDMEKKDCFISSQRIPDLPSSAAKTGSHGKIAQQIQVMEG